MLMTTEEATAVMCPAARMAITDMGCCSVKCAAWRWRDPLIRQCTLPMTMTGPRDPEPARPADVPNSWVWENDPGDIGPSAWIEPIEEAQARRRGYCGLAGKPEEDADQ